MKNRSRRAFLLEAGIVLGSAVAVPRLLGEAFVTGAAGSTRADIGESAESGIGARQAIRGLMVDAGRVPESMEYYRRVIEFCADWQLNALQFRLADDQGSALKFTSAPDLVMHRNAFTPDEMRGLAEYGRSRGVDVIPELESFGHTGYITRSQKYAHLLDQSAEGGTEFTGVIPVSGETVELFERLYAEVAEIFPSAYLHAGCDEVNWGGSVQSQKALKTQTRTQIWAEYLNKLNAIARGHEKQLIVWGDFVLHKEPEILAQLDKNIVIMDWNYSENSSAKAAGALAKVRANGSQGIGAPALICYKWGPRGGTEQLRNIDAFADAYRTPGDEASLGVILTNWVPSRYVQRSIWDGFAYAAVAMRQGTAVAQTSGLRRFVERHYEAEWSAEWDEVFALIYDDAPHVEDRETAEWMGMTLRVPWSSDEQLAAVVKDGGKRANPYTKLRSLLETVESTVTKNQEDFKAFALCVETMERTVLRESAVAALGARGKADGAAADALIVNIAARDAALAKALIEDWDEGRPADSEAKTEPLFGLQPKDQLLLQWRRAAEYSAELARTPERFRALVSRAS